MTADAALVEVLARALHDQELGCFSVCNEPVKYPDLSPAVKEEGARLSIEGHAIDAAELLSALSSPEAREALREWLDGDEEP